MAEIEIAELKKKNQQVKLQCFHCGNKVIDDNFVISDKYFCCNGCKTVFEILNAHDMCTYYALNEKPGLQKRTGSRADKFSFLDDVQIEQKLIQFKDDKQCHVVFYLPQMHCSSCLWLLEQLSTFDSGILNSQVNFIKKELFIIYDHQKTNLRKIVETLDVIGYEPHLSLNDIDSKISYKIDRTRWYKIGVAGFCFGNIMMMSFADYVATENVIESNIQTFFKVISITLSIPVLLYSASEFFIAAWKGLKQKYVNIDLPVALALIVTFVRSLYEIISGTGFGYLDSMSGIVFFMLIGRWLQSRTYQSISFDRDYKSFFPIALQVIKDGKTVAREISLVKVNDVVQVYPQEIIPVDAIVSKGNAYIDYSFVTGESKPVRLQIGDLVYAGGKQLDGTLELVVVKEVSQSYLTNLWNNPVFNKKEKFSKDSYDVIAKYFTYVVLVLGVFAGLYWYIQGNTNYMWNAFTTVLIVACPCALLLSKNYTYGNMLRILGMHKLYLRSAEVIERIRNVNHIVFDKTGTITQRDRSHVQYTGKLISDSLKQAIASLLDHTKHPASAAIKAFLNVRSNMQVEHFKEVSGSGIEAWVDDHYIQLGSNKFILGVNNTNQKTTEVYLKVDGDVIGVFSIKNEYRVGVSALLRNLKAKYNVSLLSGDNDAELEHMQQLLSPQSDILFNQSPQQKLHYISKLQSQFGKQVMMIGDGLNDAGALKQSDVGIAIADTQNSFTPSSDCVLDASSLAQFNLFLKYIKKSKYIILITFMFSALYNVVGLYFALQGILSPIIAAILMPASSITIILLSYGLTEYYAYRFGLKEVAHNNIIQSSINQI